MHPASRVSNPPSHASRVSHGGLAMELRETELEIARKKDKKDSGESTDGIGFWEAVYTIVTCAIGAGVVLLPSILKVKI
jgi:hypothetical protein